MISLFLLAAASASGPAPSKLACLPIPLDHQELPSSAIGDHEALRRALDEPMPRAPTMVLLHGRGGHLETREYSIILVRQADMTWRGTAVGRGRIAVVGAPYRSMKRARWTLDTAKAHLLDAAISRRCPVDRTARALTDRGPPPLDYVSERIDVVTPDHPPITVFATEGGSGMADLIRPPG